MGHEALRLTKTHCKKDSEYHRSHVRTPLERIEKIETKMAEFKVDASSQRIFFVADRLVISTPSSHFTFGLDGNHETTWDGSCHGVLVAPDAVVARVVLDLDAEHYEVAPLAKSDMFDSDASEGCREHSSCLGTTRDKLLRLEDDDDLSILSFSGASGLVYKSSFYLPDCHVQRGLLALSEDGILAVYNCKPKPNLTPENWDLALYQLGLEAKQLSFVRFDDEDEDVVFLGWRDTYLVTVSRSGSITYRRDRQVSRGHFVCALTAATPDYANNIWFLLLDNTVVVKSDPVNINL